MNGAAQIAAERRRQVHEEGWSASHDDAYTDGQLIDAAGCYTAAATGIDGLNVENLWPWDPAWWKPSEDPARNLVKAGALIAAELDRLRRAAGDDPYVVPRPSWDALAPEVIELGDDGRYLVAYGHLEQRIMLALSTALVAHTAGLEQAEDLVRLPPPIMHVWAVEHHTAGADDFVTWVGVHAGTDRAIPLTVMDRQP